MRTFDPLTRAGTVLLDDGVEIPYDALAFDPSGLRLLRVGQRVRIDVAGAPGSRRVAAMTIVTLPR